MGNQILQFQAEEETMTEPAADPTYSIISFPSAKLPRQYEALLFSRWLKSLRFGNNLFRKVTSKDYYKNYHLYIEKLLAKPDSVVRLAVLSDDHDVVLGFAVSREDVLDYVHVHTDYRKIGIGAKLVPQGITTFTHITLPIIDIWPANPKYRDLKFNPFA